MNEERELTRFSKTSEVLQCVLNAYCQLTGNENVYDDEHDTSMSIEDAQAVVNQLEESGE